MANLMLSQGLLRRALPFIGRRLVSTSKKKNETIAAEVCKATNEVKTQANKNWQSYGFDSKDKKADRTAMHSILFGTVTLCLALGSFLFIYFPDYHLIDWTSREAFLELRRREAQGLPLIDRNFIDPARIQLPSDEELGNTEIII